MTRAKKTIAALSLAGMAVCGAAFAVSGPKPKTVEAKIVRATESGYCTIPAWQSPETNEPEFEYVPEMIERNFHVNVPLIRGIVPKAVPNTIQTSQEAEPTKKYLGRYYITGYDTCACCCGKTDGITASGTQATVGRTCAAGKDLPFGTRLYIEGIGERIVEDRGGGVKGNHIDVLCEDHPACYAITGWYEVWVMEVQE